MGMKEPVMKKSHLILPLVLGVSCLASCGGSNDPLPTTDKEKVAFAFKGVDKSLRNQKAASQEATPRNAVSIDEGVAELYRQFDETRDVQMPDIEYNEPPLVQFQFLKQLYEATGDGYALGTTYAATVTGQFNYDFSTGKYENVLQHYSAEIGIYIGIDSTDYITAECGMHVFYTDEAGKTHEQKFYAYLGLNYDFQKNEPNYALTMWTSDDCSAFPKEEVYCSYEYDYVEVREGAIQEWRKAYVATNEKIVLDSAHPDFASYRDDELEFSGGARAYKNHKQYKTTRTGRKSADATDTAKRVALATTVVDKLGGNATDIHADAFFTRTKTENAKVVEIYNGFSRTYGIDIVASLAICGTHIYEHDDPARQDAARLRLTNAVTGQSVGLTDIAILEVPEATFADLIDNVDVYLGDSPMIPQIDLLDSNGNYLRRAQASDFHFIATFQADDGQRSFDPNPTNNVMSTIGAYGVNYLLLGLDLIRDNTLYDHVEFFVAWGEVSQGIDGWPTELIVQYGLDGFLPVFISDSPQATAQSEDTKDGFNLYIKAVSDEEIENYIESLEANGFVPYGKGINYLVNNGERVFTLFGEAGSGSLNLAIRYASAEYKTAYSDADKAIFAELGKDVLIPKFCAFRHPFSSSPNEFYYYGVTSLILDSFEQDLKGWGWTVEKESGNVDVCGYDSDDTHYEIRIERGEFALIVTYETSDKKMPDDEFLPMFIYIGSMDFMMEGDDDGNLVFVRDFSVGTIFHLQGGERRQHFFGYSALDDASKALSYLVATNDDKIMVTRDCQLRIKLTTEGGSPTIIVSLEGGESEEGDRPFVSTINLVHFKRAYLTGSFNNWDPTETSYELIYDETTSSFRITMYLDAEAKFKLTFDSKWDNCLGFNQMPVFENYPEFFVSDGEESDVKVLQSVTITLEISNIQDKTMQLSLLAKAS